VKKAKAKMLAELARLNAVDNADREWGSRLAEERDKRYSERDLANKEAVRAALAAVEKGSEKTEVALKEYKQGANEWRDTVKDLVANMPTNIEVDRRFDSISEKIQDLKASRDTGSGKSQGSRELWAYLTAAAAAAFAIYQAIGKH
jgi:hypothetical protein